MKCIRCGSSEDLANELCSKCRADEEKRHADRIAKFFRANHLARFYCRRKGKPPRPVQYDAVLRWRQFDEDGNEELAASRGGLVLLGSSFTGKTTAAYHLLRNQIETEVEDVLAVNCETLNAIPQMALDKSLGDFMDELKSAEILLIDDLDKVRITPRVSSELWGLFECRFRGHNFPLPVVITMNTRSKRDFVKLFTGREADSKEIGVSIYHRIAEVCEFIDFDVEQAKQG